MSGKKSIIEVRAWRSGERGREGGREGGMEGRIGKDGGRRRVKRRGKATNDYSTQESICE